MDHWQRRSCQTKRAGFVVLLGAVLCILLPGRPQAGEPVSIVMAHGPLEIGGVAVLPDGKGFAVVADETETHGRIWPSGKAWPIKPSIKDLESVDVAIDEAGDQLWLVLGEEEGLLAEPNAGGARQTLGETFRMVCGRGLEGLSLRRKNGIWQAVVLWEGGYFDPRKCTNDTDRKMLAKTPRAKPKIGLIHWQKGVGVVKAFPPVTLDVPTPPEGHFRATDVTWHGDHLIVLLGSTGKGGGRPYAHTWLQRFALDGAAVGEPVRLETEWGKFRKGKNWEALDAFPDGRRLVMGYDTKSGSSALAIFKNPFR